MFENIRQEFIKQEPPEFQEEINSALYSFNPRLDKGALYLEAVGKDDIKLIKRLILSNAIDVNFKFRFYEKTRDNSDMVPLKIAIEKYFFELAELLLSYGHTRSGFVVQLYGRDRDNLFAESYKRAKQFCIDNHIDYIEEEEE